MNRILIVDDEDEPRNVMVERFEGKYDVVSAKDEKEAIEIIEKYPPFDLVITDLRMTKDEGGIDVLKAAKNKDSLTEVIIITAHGTLGNVHTAMELGIWTYIDKEMTNVYDVLDIDAERALEHKQKAENEQRLIRILKEAVNRFKEKIQIEFGGERRLEGEESIVGYGPFNQEELTEFLGKEKEIKFVMLVEALIEFGLMPEDDLIWSLSKYLNIPKITVRPEESDIDLVKSIPKDILLKHTAIPLIKDGDRLVLVMADPKDIKAREEIEKIARCKANIFLGAPTEIKKAIERIFR